MKRSLREGFTTGTAATAAAMAATRTALGDEVSFVRVPLPPFDSVQYASPMEECSGVKEGREELIRPFGPYIEGGMRFWDIVPAFCRKLKPGLALSGVIKDGGDDPDATNGLMIEVLILLKPHWKNGEVVIKGGCGVGVVTLPGLSVPIGYAAINPVPMLQIRRGIAMELSRSAWRGGVSARIIVPEGKSRARHTLNPRLGILGGISILGTQGIVRPYSHDAWQATILQGLSVAQNLGFQFVALSTGRRTERLLMSQFSCWPAQCFIQAADHMQFSVERAIEFGFRHIVIGLFFGKLVKLAQGIGHTHAHAAPMSMEALSSMLAELGLESELVVEVGKANTALHVLQIMERSLKSKEIIEALCCMVLRNIEAWAAARMPFGSRDVHVTVFLFSSEEKLLVRVDNVGLGKE